jgi:succinoglycan biosynthesis protein ExoO
MLDILLSGGRYAVSRTPGYLYTARSSGLSRTRIDYDAMAADTLALLGDSRLRSDRRLKKLLRQRYGAVRRLSAEIKAPLCLRERQFGRLIANMLRDYDFCRAVFSIVASKAARWSNRLEVSFRRWR